MLFTRMDGVGRCSHRWTALIVNKWVSMQMDCVDRQQVGVDADGQDGSSFTQMDCVDRQ